MRRPTQGQRERMDAIKSALADGPARVTDLAAQTGLRRGAVYDCISALLARREIERDRKVGNAMRFRIVLTCLRHRAMW